MNFKYLIFCKNEKMKILMDLKLKTKNEVHNWNIY